MSPYKQRKTDDMKLYYSKCLSTVYTTDIEAKIMRTLNNLHKRIFIF